MDLREFEVHNKSGKGPLCTVCALSPELRAELNEAEKRGTTRPVMARYLQDVHGSTIQSFTIGDHFRKGHAKKETQ
jgi:hypothetical protein